MRVSMHLYNMSNITKHFSVIKSLYTRINFFSGAAEILKAKQTFFIERGPFCSFAKINRLAEHSTDTTIIG